jgi:putative Holliday junction resolvase
VSADGAAARLPGAVPRLPPGSAERDQVVLGFDFGNRRIGLAIGNGITARARPLDVVQAEGAARWQALGEAIAQWQPGLLVVGVPRHPDGAPHAMTARCERFARQLEGRFGLPVARVDERYSSVEATALAADARMASRGAGRAAEGGDAGDHRGTVGHRGAGKNGDLGAAPIDALAAMVILQQWFDTPVAVAAGGHEPGERR